MRSPGGTALDHQVGFDRHGKAQHQRRRHRQGEKAEKAAMAARGAGEAGTGEAHRGEPFLYSGRRSRKAGGDVSNDENRHPAVI